MRTTIDLDESLLLAAKAIARDEGSSLGAVLSRLAAQGLQQAAPVSTKAGFPVFARTASSKPITLDAVNDGRDGE